MANKKRKKKQKEADFKKVKLKVGKKLPKGLNETQTSFKSQGIVVPSQDLVKEGQLTNMKKQNLKDLLVHLNHYSATVRQDSLIGLKALFQLHETELHDNLSLLLSSIASKMTDTDSDVRHSLLILLQFILPKISSDQVAPFLPLLVAHLSCAMTHIYGDIQLQSLKFLSLFVDLYPKQMKRYSKEIFNNLLGLISHGNAVEKIDGKLASPMSKLNILNQMLAFLKIAYDIHTTLPSCLDFDSNREVSPICFEQEKATYIPLFTNSAQEPKLQRFSFEGQGDLNQKSTGIKELIQKTVPMLLEIWVECSPSQLATSLPNSSLSSMNLSAMITIMRILKILLQALYKEDSSGLMTNWFAASYFKDFKMHFMRFFPFQATLLTKGKGKSRSDSGDGDSVLMLNVSVCEIMSVFTAHATRYEPWRESVEEFIMETLESTVNKINIQQLHSILVYLNNVLLEQISQSEMESSARLLDSLHKFYQSSHMLSAVKIETFKFFAALYLKLNQLDLSGFKVSSQLKSIVNQWTKTLPKHLAQLKISNPEITKVVAKLPSKLLTQNADLIDTQKI